MWVTSWNANNVLHRACWVHPKPGSSTATLGSVKWRSAHRRYGPTAAACGLRLARTLSPSLSLWCIHSRSGPSIEPPSPTQNHLSTSTRPDSRFWVSIPVCFRSTRFTLSNSRPSHQCSFRVCSAGAFAWTFDRFGAAGRSLHSSNRSAGDHHSLRVLRRDGPLRKAPELPLPRRCSLQRPHG